MVSEANGKRREDCLGSIENSTNGIDYSLHRKVNIWSEQFYSLREFVENSRHPETAARVTQEGEGSHWSIEYFSCPNLASAQSHVFTSWRVARAPLGVETTSQTGAGAETAKTGCASAKARVCKLLRQCKQRMSKERS